MTDSAPTRSAVQAEHLEAMVRELRDVLGLEEAAGLVQLDLARAEIVRLRERVADLERENGALLVEGVSLRQQRDAARAQSRPPFEEADRQLVLLALAVLSLESPGFDDALNRIAVTIDNVVAGRGTMYDAFRVTRVRPAPPDRS